MMRFFRNLDYWPLIIFSGTLLIYLHNLSNTVAFGDNGDFLAAGLVKGVPHPSGYPFVTILAILVNYLPLLLSPAWKMNIIAPIFSSSTVLLIYYLIKNIASSRLFAFITSLSVAFVYPFWQYAEFLEVFPIYNFFIFLFFFLTVKWYQTKKQKYLYFFAFFSGLSFTNNEAIILIIIPLSFSLLASNIFQYVTFKIIIRCILLFILGLIPYLYIPIASSYNPAVNWDNAASFSGFLNLVSRKDYGWSFNQAFDLQSSYRTLQLSLRYWVNHLTFPVILICIVGMFKTLKLKTYYYSLTFVGIILITMPLFIYIGKFEIADNFDFAILERFIITSGAIFLMFLPFGIKHISSFLQKNLSKYLPNKYLTSIPIAFLLIPLYFFIINFTKNDFHNIDLGKTFAQDIFSTSPPNSTIYFENDTPLFNSYYLKLSEKYRPDVELVTPANPLLFKSVPEIYINQTVTKNIVTNSDRNEFLESRKPYLYLKHSYNCIPYGLLCKLINTSKFTLSEKEYLQISNDIFKKYHLSQILAKNQIISGIYGFSDIKQMYALAYINTGQFLETQYNNRSEAIIFYNKATQIDPNITEYLAGYAW